MKYHVYHFSYTELGGKCWVIARSMEAARFDGMSLYLQHFEESALCKHFGVDRKTLINETLQCGFVLECVEQAPEPDHFRDVITGWMIEPKELR